MTEDDFFTIALTMVPQVGPVQAKILLQHMRASEIFRTRKMTLQKIDGVGVLAATEIIRFKNFHAAEREMKFIDKHGIRVLPLTSEGYPSRLLHCFDPPTILFQKGETSLNHPKIIAVIGTRHHSDYGKQLTESLLNDLASHNIMIVSGLAYGIDALAHKSALKNQLPTIGVLAHGLSFLYPSEHQSLARDICRQNGSLLTEFLSSTKPDKHNFPIRNRIVAGMCDATVVIETGLKGGSMITADLSNGYNRDVFAFPGRATDTKSEGCLSLVKQNKAILLTDADQLLEVMGWKDEKSPAKKKQQRELFIQMTPEEETVVGILRETEWTHIDDLTYKSALSSSKIAKAILRLEMEGVLISTPGKMYGLA